MKIPVFGSVSLLCASAALAVQIQSNPPPAGAPASPTNPTAGSGQANPPVPITNPTGQPILARPCVPTAGPLATTMSSAPIPFHRSGLQRGRAGSHDQHSWREHERARDHEPGSLAGTIQFAGFNDQFAGFDHDVEFGNRTGREFSVVAWYECARFVQHDGKCN